jgi:hypothetical protein
MSTLVITTFSQDGYNLYGRRFVETWCEYWPEDYTLRIYAEHDLRVNDPRVEIVDLHSVSPDLVKFKKHGYAQAETAEDRKLRNKYIKTVKWCHKVYAIKHALDNDADCLIFLDADTYTKHTVAPGELEHLNSSLFAVHFEHLKGMRHYETGLIIFDMHHPKMPTLKQHITEAYDSLEIYELPKSWDGFWFPELAARYNLPVTDLAKRKRGVFCNPVVNKLLVHAAGNDKYKNTNYDKFSGKAKSNLKI